MSQDKVNSKKDPVTSVEIPARLVPKIKKAMEDFQVAQKAANDAIALSESCNKSLSNLIEGFLSMTEHDFETNMCNLDKTGTRLELRPVPPKEDPSIEGESSPQAMKSNSETKEDADVPVNQ